MINKDNYKNQVEKLKKYAYAYYVEDAPLVTDEEYDKLYHEVLDFEEKNPDKSLFDSPTKRVGGVVRDGFTKSEHIKRMWSMEDVFNMKDVQKWIDRISKSVDCSYFICEPKFDGASLNLIYKNGVLQKAITRGNGVVGEDVTENAKTIRSIPLVIDYKELIEIRGEVVIRIKDFEKINAQRLKDEKPLFSNPRNAASGSLRQLDSTITAKRRLFFYPWGVGENELKESSLSKKMDFIYNLGFLKPPLTKECKDIDDIQNIYSELIKTRDNIPMMMDGMVIKVDQISLQEELGYTVKYPKWMVAYKFPAVEKSTTIKAITLQVGRSGVITPVAEVEAVDIDGAIIERATLHNFDEIERKDIRIGDRVIIIRSGDVIPKIIKVQEEFRDGTQILVTRPLACPICQKELLDEGTLIKCQNLACRARVVNSIRYATSKKCLDISGLGEKIVESLFQNGLVSTLLDIFYLTKDQLLDLEGFQDKKAQKLIDAIKNAKNIECWRLLNSLGIEHIGEVASKSICIKYGNDYLTLDSEQLNSIDGIGIEMANSFIEFMRVNHETVVKLQSILTPLSIEKKDIEDNIFKDKVVVITGSMSRSRQDIKELLESLGAKVTNSVSKKSDFVIYGENAGSKYEKAKRLKIELLSEDEMKKLVKE